MEFICIKFSLKETNTSFSNVTENEEILLRDLAQSWLLALSIWDSVPEPREESTFYTVNISDAFKFRKFLISDTFLFEIRVVQNLLRVMIYNHNNKTNI